MDREPHFSPRLFSFLRDLAQHNNRDWFEGNRFRYEEDLKEPALQFISDFGPRLRRISPNFMAIPRTNKGSLFRIYRDTRFSNDKRPYKTHAGLHFRHKQSGDVHAPGFYLHLEPGGCFAAIGVWRPDGPSLRRIRDAIVAGPSGWKRAKSGKRFQDVFQIGGETLKTAPRGYDPQHPHIDDLRRKDFVATAPFSEDEVLAADFLSRFTAVSRAGTPFIRFLCKAVGVLF